MFDFSLYCGVADYLVKIPTEANIRSGISRYYYAGLCCVRNYLVETMNETEFINGFRIHKRICDRLINSQDDTEASIGEKLIFLKNLEIMQTMIGVLILSISMKIYQMSKMIQN